MEKIHTKIVIPGRKDILSQMKEEIFQNDELLTFLLRHGVNKKIVEANIPLIYRYMQDRSTCQNCPGLANCKKDNKHLIIQLINDDGVLKKKLSPCQPMLKEMILENKFIYHDFPDSFLLSTLKEMDKNSTRLNAFNQFVKNLKCDDPKWLYIKGVKHSGKTYLTATMGLEYIKKYKGTVAHIDCPLRFEELSSLFYSSRPSFYNELLIISNAKILVLDNFGEETKYDHVRDEILLPILKYRQEHRLLTIFVSEYDQQEIVNMYSKSRLGRENAKELLKYFNNKCDKIINLGTLPIYQ